MKENLINLAVKQKDREFFREYSLKTGIKIYEVVSKAAELLKKGKK